MRTVAPTRLMLLLIVGIGLLWARVGGTHLHLCLDACATESRLHLDTSAHHAQHHGDDHAHGHTGGHSDVDLPLFDHLLTKSTQSVQDLPLALPVLLMVLLLSFAPAGHPRAPRRNVHAPPLHPLRPPLRGPPHPTS